MIISPVMLHDYFFKRTFALPHPGSAFYLGCLAALSVIVFRFPHCASATLLVWDCKDEKFFVSLQIYLKIFFLRFLRFSAGFQYPSSIALSVFNPSVSGLQR